MQNQSITPATLRVAVSELSVGDLEWLSLLLQPVDPAARAAVRTMIQLRLQIGQLPAHQQPQMRQLAIALLQ